MMKRLWRWLTYAFEPIGYGLYRVDGKRHNGIRYDLIDPDALVIEEDGRYFVRTRERIDGFIVYREDYRTEHYRSY
jgi:hypothetical protein